MSRLYLISFWLLIGVLAAGLVEWLNPKDIDSLLRYAFPFTFAMFSLNFSAISACSNALLKYKEQHSDKEIYFVVEEMKENLIAMLFGIVLVFVASIFKNVSDSPYLEVICNTIIFAVLTMYLHLVMDIALAFFNIVKNKE